MYTDKDAMELKKKDDSSDIDVSPYNANTGTSTFFISVLLIIVYFIISPHNVCQMS